MKPGARDAALKAGETQYHSDKPCPRGHVGARSTRNYRCLRCHNERRIARNAQRYKTDPMFRARRRAALRTPHAVERYNKWRKGWRARNPDLVAAAQKRQQGRPRRRSIPERLRHRLRKRLKDLLQGKSATLLPSTLEFFGCTSAAAALHIQSQFKPGMSWDNWGFGPDKWHVDHIQPLASFDLTDPEQLRAACHYTNLQPLWQAENLSKGAKVNDLLTNQGENENGYVVGGSRVTPER